MLKIDEKETPDPKMNDFEWFGEVFNFSMFNMFSVALSLCSFLKLILNQFWCLSMHFKA